LSVIDDIEHDRAPFCDPWPSWTPDRSWRLPYLPTGWSNLHRSLASAAFTQHPRPAAMAGTDPSVSSFLTK